MPRLDPYYPEVRQEFDREYDPDDPGATDPVDLCQNCASSFDETYEVDHPPYDDPVGLGYTCELCGETLTAQDD